MSDKAFGTNTVSVLKVLYSSEGSVLAWGVSCNVPFFVFTCGTLDFSDERFLNSFFCENQTKL